MSEQQIAEVEVRRAAARRTAAMLGAIAVLVFVMFCLKAVKIF
jgi:hypothetical protein